MADLHSVSTEQKHYLQAQKRNIRLIQASRILLLILFLGLWEITARLGILDSFIYSSPSQILDKMCKMISDGSLAKHVSVTLTETLISFALVTLLGIFCAVILWIFPRLSSILEPYLVVLNSLPKSALAPLLIVWLGSNMKTIIIAGISVAVFGAVLNLYTGFCETDPDKLKLIQTLGGNKKDALIKVILPASVPLILSVMKVNIGLSLIGIVIGEMIGSKQGLFNYLFQSGISAHYHDYGNCYSVCHRSSFIRLYFSFGEILFKKASVIAKGRSPKWFSPFIVILLFFGTLLYP